MKSRLYKQIEHFSSLATVVSSICSKYNIGSVMPFLEAAQIYNENFRSNTEFRNLLRVHTHFMQGSVIICSSLFDNYESAKQNAMYDWSKKIFNLINLAKKIIDEAYQLAYTVGRTDDVTNNIIKKEQNPLVKIQRNVVLEEGEFEVYKKTLFDWKCEIQAIYVEEEFMKHIVELCNARKSKLNPKDVNVKKCTFRPILNVQDLKYESTPQICKLNSELLSHKIQIQNHEKNNKLTINDIDEYIVLYTRYQRELISFVFTNFLKLYNERCVQCLRIFLEQQHSIVFNLIQVRKKLMAMDKEKITEEKRIDSIMWNSDIDKSKVCSADNSQSCSNRVKVVGSLE